MKHIQFATASAIALLLIGCSKSVDNASSGTAFISGPRVEVVHLPGTPPPITLRVAQPGVAGDSAANNDSPAVEFVFKVENELPTASVKEASVTNLTLVFGPPLVGNQELHVRINTTLAKVKGLKQWSVGNPDSDGGLLAWVCPAGDYPCDFATSGTVTFTDANDQFIEAHANLIFQSKNTIEGRLSAEFTPRAKPSVPALGG